MLWRCETDDFPWESEANEAPSREHNKDFHWSTDSRERVGVRIQYGFNFEDKSCGTADPSQIQEEDGRLDLRLDSIAVSVFEVILVQFDKYRIWDEQACLVETVSTLRTYKSLETKKHGFKQEREIDILTVLALRINPVATGLLNTNFTGQLWGRIIICHCRSYCGPSDGPKLIWRFLASTTISRESY